MGFPKKGGEMPTGVYKRTAKHNAQMRRCLEMGRSKEARKKAAETMRKKANETVQASGAWGSRKEMFQSNEFRKRVSEATKKRMHDPEVRKRHLAGLKRARKKHGVNFKGGNGQPMLPIVAMYNKVLSQIGYVREYPVKTKGHNTPHRCPDSYKVDFGNPTTKVAIELDGQKHTPMAQRALDAKKTEVLSALGWRVIRIQHQGC